MAQKNVGKKILTSLFVKDQSIEDLENSLGLPNTVIFPTITEMVKLNVLAQKGSNYTVRCVSKRPKMTYTRENSSVDEVLSFYKKRRSWAKLEANEKTHNGPKGNPEQWRRTAEKMRDRLKGVVDATQESLKILGLRQIPVTVSVLDKARRKAMLEAHPDLGGDTEKAQKINEAYSKIKKQIR